MYKTERKLLKETAETVSRLQSEIAELKTHKKFHYRFSINYRDEFKQFNLYMDFPLFGKVYITYKNNLYFVKNIRYFYANSVYFLELLKCDFPGSNSVIIDLTGYDFIIEEHK